jgi:hypothetical protein
MVTLPNHKRSQPPRPCEHREVGVDFFRVGRQFACSGAASHHGFDLHRRQRRAQAHRHVMQVASQHLLTGTRF